MYCGNNPIMFVDPSGLFRVIDGRAYDKYQLGSGNANNSVNDYVSKDIQKMQMRLQELGHLDKSIDSYEYFGTNTLNAINAFKRKAGIKNDTNNTKGIVGATTWAYLGLEFDVMETLDNTWTNLTMEPGALHIKADAGNISKSTITSIYLIATNARDAYKIAFGESFNVSTNSLYTEILGHLFPNAISKKYGNSTIWKEIQSRTNVIDIGDDVLQKDGNRKYWDRLVGDKK